jgi:hypothetical protein
VTPPATPRARRWTDGTRVLVALVLAMAVGAAMPRRAARAPRPRRLGPAGGTLWVNAIG